MDRARSAVRASSVLPLVRVSSRIASSRENPTEVIRCMASSGNEWAWLVEDGGGRGGCEVGEGLGSDDVEMAAVKYMCVCMCLCECVYVDIFMHVYMYVCICLLS